MSDPLACFAALCALAMAVGLHLGRLRCARCGRGGPFIGFDGAKYVCYRHRQEGSNDS